MSISLGFSWHDPDSQRLLTFIKLWLWPGFRALAVLAVALVWLRWDWLVAAFQMFALMWVMMHLIWRPLSFLRDLRDVFAKSSKALADIGGPLIAWLNARFATVRVSREEEARYVPATLAAVNVDPFADQKPRVQRSRFQWERAAELLFNWKLYAAIALIGLLLWGARACSSGGPWQPSGREVAAECATNIAEAERETFEAEARQREQAIQRLEARNATLERLNQETRNAEREIADAPNLDAAAAALAAFDRSVRDASASARSAAVQNYRASLGP